jgi:hypothetical protein
MNEFLDHIIWACDNLERGSRRFEALTGVSPRYGGMHASGLTHNALVALGPRCYLEILAPAKPQAPGDDDWCRLARASHEPHTMTYCMRSSRPLTELAASAEGLGAENGKVLSNGRTTPEGVHLSWQWLRPTIDRFGLAFPFFIDWLDSPHPADSLAKVQTQGGVHLRDFSVGHPQAAELRQTLAQLGVSIDTYAAPAIEFRVRLTTPRGVVSL